MQGNMMNWMTKLLTVLFYMIFTAEDRVDLEKEQMIKDTAICQLKVADAILFFDLFYS